MENYNNTLYSLNKTNYQVVDGEPDITGWEVRSETGAYIGKTIDLLFDAQHNAVRYLVVDLDGSGMHLDEKKILIPIGIAELHRENDEVTLPNLHLEQFIAMPAYAEESFGPAMESEIRAVIGSPAALRLENEIVAQDLKNFYAHHHFERSNFYNRNRSAEQQTIHNLVEKAKANHLHTADIETEKGNDPNIYKDAQEDQGNQEPFTPGHHEKKPWLEPGASHNQGKD
jgi:hypothetical protein